LLVEQVEATMVVQVVEQVVFVAQLIQLVAVEHLRLP
jgi:hypothetical protein